jgi:hypothetical protein
MNRQTRIASYLLAVALAAIGLSASAARAQLVQHYEILPGSTYTYFPSSFGPAIAGCSPSEFECAFGVAGKFSVEFDSAAPPNTARFTHLDLLLVGNEDIQNNPPIVVPVTSDRVEAWLAARVFNQLPVAAPINYFEESQFRTLSLTDFLNGTIQLAGGYDARLVDGDGLNFQVSARLVPEPATVSLGAIALLFCCVGRRTFV